MVKYCSRCTTEFRTEKHLLFGLYFCRACYDTIENDPDYAYIMIRLNTLAVNEALRKLPNIEN